MKGPSEEKDSDWLVEKARNCLNVGDEYAAKSWLLTAKTLFPNSFNIQVRYSVDYYSFRISVPLK